MAPGFVSLLGAEAGRQARLRLQGSVTGGWPGGLSLADRADVAGPVTWL